MEAALSIGLGIVVVLAITGLTGYFVAQEFAYMAVDRSRLKARAESGDVASSRALTVTGRTSFMLSGAQLGITVTGLLVGYVAEPLIGQGLSTLLGGAGIPTAVGVAVGATIAIGFSTIVQMLFGELFPKNLAISRPEPVARWLARSTTWYLRLSGWLIWLFDQSSNLLLRALRIEPVHDVEHSATPRDLEHIVAASRIAGELPQELSVLLDRILDFPTSTAEHAMIPRSLVDVVHEDELASDVLARMGSNGHGHTRYPVIGETLDDIVGIVRLHDLLADQGGTAGQRCRPAIVVPSTLPLGKVLTALESGTDEMALVVDEYGGFAGVVTVEDIAEELVGEIADEHDESAYALVEDGDGWIVPGGMHLDEVERLLGRTLPEADQQTLAGLVIAEFGGLPAIGDTVAIDLPTEGDDLIAVDGQSHWQLVSEVRELGRRVPSLLHVALRELPEQSEEGGHRG